MTGQPNTKPLSQPASEPACNAMTGAELYRAVLDAVPEPVGVYDRELRACYMNPAGCRALNRPLDQIVGKTEQELWPENATSPWLPHLKQTAQTRKPHSFEISLPEHGEKTAQYVVTYVPCLSERGELQHIVALGFNVTQRKQYENALRQSEQRYRTLVDNAPVGIGEADQQGRFISANEALLKIAHCTREQFLHMSLADFWLPEDRKAARDRFHALVSGQVPNYTVEQRYRRPDGTICWGRAAASVNRNPDGSFASAVAILEDVTERRQQEEALRQSEEQFRQAFSYAPIGMVLTDLEGHFLHVNDAFCHLVGYPREELLAPDYTFQKLTHPEDLPYNMEEYRRLINGEIPAFFIEKRYLRSDGRTVWVRASASLRRDTQGQPAQIVGLVEDITARRESEQQLRLARDQLEQRVRERTAQLQQRAHQLARLAAELTLAEQRERNRIAELLHDHLQQILVGSRFHLDLALNRATRETRLAEQLRKVGALLEDAIEISRSLSHELSPPTLRQQGLLATLEWLTRQMHRKYRLDIDLHADPDAEPHYEPIKIFLFKAAQEFFFNIVKHADTRQATLNLSRQHHLILLEVADNGRGFDPESAAPARPHAGFGLFSIRERVTLLGGSLRIEAHPGQGSRFLLSVPDSPSEEHLMPETPPEMAPAPAQQPSPLDESQPAPAPHAPLRLLLADDHRVMRQALAMLLDEEPDLNVVAEADNGKHAVDLVDQFHPDIIVMDVSMPVMDGVTATRIIKREHPNVRVIGLSMFNREDLARDMFAAGADAYLSKSDPSEQLLDAIRSNSKLP